MVEHVYRRAAQAHVDAVIVATDDQRIVDAVERFGGIACLTRPDHLSGTDRLAELAAELPCDIVVNVQGDEPLLDPAAIDTLVGPLAGRPDRADVDALPAVDRPRTMPGRRTWSRWSAIGPAARCISPGR